MCGYEIYRGITTGLNDAFIIDNQTKDALVAEEPKSTEIIKPVLRGRDIDRYRAKWAGMWLIDTHNGYDEVPAIDIDDYPAIKTFLDGHYEKLANRYDKGRTPYNLRNCTYGGLAMAMSNPRFWANTSANSTRQSTPPLAIPTTPRLSLMAPPVSWMSWRRRSLSGPREARIYSAFSRPKRLTASAS